jgi:hypothetical protein
VPAAPVRYLTHDEDSGRWDRFTFRSGDIVISTRSKSGTTWMQMICALLVFGTPELPQPLDTLSPWLDWSVEPIDAVLGRLDAQTHRRFVKTHTPLDGVPIDSRATYIVVARHPLDMAVSLWHQRNNTDRARLRELTGQPPSDEPDAPAGTLHDWLVAWIDADGDRLVDVDSLLNAMWHLSDAWARVQAGAPNVVLVHYDDLRSDLAGEMRRLAARLGITVDETRWPELVQAATFDAMRDRAHFLAPAANGVLKDRSRFFRRGVSGTGREVLSAAELARYHARTARLAPADLLAWLHRDGGARQAR